MLLLRASVALDRDISRGRQLAIKLILPHRSKYAERQGRPTARNSTSKYRRKWGVEANPAHFQYKRSLKGRSFRVPHSSPFFWRRVDSHNTSQSEPKAAGLTASGVGLTIPLNLLAQFEPGLGLAVHLLQIKPVHRGVAVELRDSITTTRAPV
jgi:hypothetical protein